MKIIGHRGARGLAPENTIASLLKALEHNVDEIEFDVRVTADNVCILVHDAFLKDAAGKHLRVSKTPFATLKKHKPDLCTLEEAIRFIDRRVPLIIEVKPRVALEPITEILRKLLKQGWKNTDFYLASFQQSQLRALHIALPEITKVINEEWSGVRARQRAKQVNTTRLSMRSWWLWSLFLKGMSRSGYQISPYTINNPRLAHRWAKYGLYGTITDYPDLYQSDTLK